MRLTKLALTVVALATVAAVGVAGPARADTVAQDGGPVVVAEDPTAPPPAASTTRIVGVDANIVAGLTVTGHGGSTVAATARGHATRSATVPATRAAILRRLVPGVVYTITIAGTRIGTAIPVAQVGAASRLRVETTGVAGELRLAWQHTPNRGEGGPTVRYDVLATPAGTPTGAQARSGPPAMPVTAIAATTAITLTGLDVDQLYAFTVTPRNSAGTGPATRATMTRSLAQITGRTVPTTPAPVPAVAPATPAPAPVPAPAPAPPSTKTIYVCPDGYPETTAGLCQKTLAYTYDVRPYTQHWGVIGWHSVDDVYAANVGPLAQGPVCPWGGVFDGVGLCVGATSHRVDDYGWIKDPTPTGYTDTGTTWRKKNPTPTGYTDDGTQWVTTVPKVARTVPA